ncbi:hypothetical protein C9374_001650 [Naegleria lovaniensis]|uniref:Uncharacterized protein n=1 Tax=Naegleria lovaniensis TaxID=51637 RepID=A0AA88GVY1_NAELO|nr:uncharacterized protein C9374_001650 [Naegleria lovaniensis]KAG2387318.1 hypothetical protein C9374_001650 [Naegleria lovaniensis]
MGTPASRDDYTKSKTFRSTMFTSKGFEYFGKVFEKIDLINMPDLKRKKESPCTPVIKSKASPGSYTATPPSSRPNYERETISSASKKVVPKGGSSEKRPKKRVARQRKKIPLVQLELRGSRNQSIFGRRRREDLNV